MELEALASRKFTKYRAYVRLYNKLRDCSTLEQCAKVAGELVDNYIDNRLIWQELHWYQEHGSILGKHPAFAEFRRRRQLNEMAKGDKPHLDTQRQERLAGYEKERADILRLLE